MLGLKPKDKLVMYCDTKAEWMVTALGCFKFNYTMVTIYTNLGEDGVTYGIHQTQSNYVCTSQELLPKLIKVLDKVRIFYNNDYAGTLRTIFFLPPLLIFKYMNGRI